jgi:serine/threonine protein kinase
MNDPPSSAKGRAALVAGKYEVLRLIGRGGMGSVWEGRHVSLGTRVAIKFVDAEHAGNEEARSRFVTEARAAAAIQSKHAIQIFDHGLADDGRPYIVMELLLGEPLDARIERQGRLSLAETARILGQVCRALIRAHEAGIIHRDLKPENIFLVRSPEDEDEAAKVLDFGIAKIRVAFEGSDPTSSTQTGAVLGTPYYMSPEQARGFRTIDHRTDLWSLGVIAYKCVTGVLPFEGQSVGDLLVNICTGPLPIPSRGVPELPATFDAWFARAIDRAPEGRFSSATELADALAACAGISLRRGAPASEGTSFAPSRRPSPMEIPSTANPGPGPTAGGNNTSASNTSAPFTAPASPPKASRGMIAGVAFASVVAGSVGIVAVARFLALGPPTFAPAAVRAPTSAPTNAVDGASTARVAPSSVAATGSASSVAAAATATASAPPVASPATMTEKTAPSPARTADRMQAAAKVAAPAAPPPVRPAARPTSSADPGY